MFVSVTVEYCFSPLAGISFVERMLDRVVQPRQLSCFSPLAGISFVESFDEAQALVSVSVIEVSVPLRGLVLWKVRLGDTLIIH